MKFYFRLMDEAGARQIVGWRYDAPYQMYSLQDESAADEVVQYLLDDKNHFYRIDDEQGQFLAFCSFGDDAQVNGGDYSKKALDVGLGLRPDLTGHGLGTKIIAAVLEFALESFELTHFRVTIAAFNQRAQKAWLHNGFTHRQDFHRAFDQFPFVILTRPAVLTNQD